MNTQRVGAALAAGVVALSVTACGSSDKPSAGSDKPYIAIVSKGFQQQFWQAVRKGAEQQAAKEGARITFVGPATEADVEQQFNMLTFALAKKPSAIALAALDSKVAEPLLEQAQSRKVPVIGFDSGVDSDIPITTVATDNEAAAEEAAKHMAQLLGGKGKVAMVVHDQTSNSGIDRRDGFMKWMTKNAPGITVLAPQYGGGDQLKSADITKSILTANPDLAGIYGSNEGSATGVITGVRESGRSDVTIVGFDSGKAQIDAIKSGVEAGAITQDPAAIGREIVKAAMKSIRGEKVPKVVNTGYYWYDKSNVDDPKIAQLLYQ